MNAMVDKIDILANFDLENNLSDCSSDENLSDLSLSDTSSENCYFEECNNEVAGKNSDLENEIFKRETVDLVSVVAIAKSNDTNENEVKSDNVSVTSERTFKLDSPKAKETTPRSQRLSENEEEFKTQRFKEAKKIEITESALNNNTECFDDGMSFKPSEVDSNDLNNDEFSLMEQSLDMEYKQFLDSSDKNIREKNEVNDKFKQPKDELHEVRKYTEADSMTPDEKRFQNLQEEINLLNILMFEAENQTEKCGSLYNSFTNEINNNLAYSKTGVVDDCAGSLASLVDGSKFDALSVKSELLFSDYGKSESNFGASENQDQDKVEDKTNFDDVETKSVSSTAQAMSVDSKNSDCKTCKECEVEKNWDSKSEGGYTTMSNEDRIIILWNQIIRLKCSLKNLQLNLKEQQMDTLMQINEFLINQNITSNQVLNSKTHSSSSCTLFDRNKEARKIHENLSDTSLIFTENNKVRENIALNDLKIALIECNLLSSTASSLVDSIPKYESTDTDISKSKISSSHSSKSCCCHQIMKRPVCSCFSKTNSSFQSSSKSDRSIKFEDNHRMTRQSYMSSIMNQDDKTDRKVKSHEEIGNKFPDTKYCLSEVRLDEISPRACI